MRSEVVTVISKHVVLTQPQESCMGYCKSLSACLPAQPTACPSRAGHGLWPSCDPFTHCRNSARHCVLKVVWGWGQMIGQATVPAHEDLCPLLPRGRCTHCGAPFRQRDIVGEAWTELTLNPSSIIYYLWGFGQVILLP